MKLPALSGATREDAIARLEALGLRADVEENGDLLEALLGGEWIVCASDPAAGSDVRRGTAIHLTVAKGC